MSAAFHLTLEHVKTREQFGRSLSALQTVRHRLVDMHIALTEASALTNSAIDLADAATLETEHYLLARRAGGPALKRDLTALPPISYTE